MLEEKVFSLFYAFRFCLVGAGENSFALLSVPLPLLANTSTYLYTETSDTMLEKII